MNLQLMKIIIFQKLKDCIDIDLVRSYTNFTEHI